MICPACGHDNFPGRESCSNCLHDLTQLDRPVSRDRVERSLMENPVGGVLPPRDPITVHPTATIQDAIAVMLANDVGALLVVDQQGSLLGIFSERDLLTKVAGLHPSYRELPVGQFMTSKPETIAAEAPLAYVVHKMDVGGYRHVPVVVGDGRPSGMVSVRDILRHITRACKKSELRGRH